MLRVFLLAGAAGSVLLLSSAAYAQSDDQTETVVVTARKLDEARSDIQTQLGATTYTIDEAAIAAMPGGDNNQLNQVLLQMPGVVQDQYGQLHIRAEHNALQYRLDGVVLPEGISVFSQTLDPRLAGSVKLITGALPAEYGLVTGGIIDVQTKTGLFDSGGQISMYGGDHSDMQPSASYGGSDGNWNYFIEGDYLQNRLGIDSPDGESNPHHDYTSQYHGFGYAEDILDSHSRIAMTIGTSHDNFEIPDTLGYPNPTVGPQPSYTIDGISPTPSGYLNDRQAEITHFGSVSYLRSEGSVDMEISAFSRFSSLAYSPDQNLGDLSYLGISQNAYKRDIGYGLQSDNAWRALPDHTIRFGFLAQKDDLESITSAQVLPAACTGNGSVANPFNCTQSSNTPYVVDDNGKKTSQSFSAYVQDEWQIVKWLTANYGVRYDRFTAFSEGNQVSPRVNFVVTPLDGTTLHAGYARYFSPPPFELIASESVAKFSNSTATTGVTTDTTPVAERADYFDTGAQQKLSNTIFDGDDMTLGTDAFLKMSHDLIDEGQFGAPIILTPFNYKRGLQYGVDYDITYDTGPFSAYANLNFQHATGKDIVTSQFNFSADDLAYIQNHYIHLDHEQAATASAGVSYLWEGTRFSLDGIYGSGLRQDDPVTGVPNGEPLKPYVQANFGVMHTFTLPAAGDVQFRIDVINITDTAYEIRSGTGVGVGAPSWGERRSVYFGITKPFG
ncbi:MAG TPA: TonB-dependent receptor [Rhizomicrobium sp.]|nr:TonB-dependent receptor [Rhizomicrobium sp.]